MTQFLASTAARWRTISTLQQGRVQVSVPAVLGEGRLSWAMPCVPTRDLGLGSSPFPPVGANVWVEFEVATPTTLS